MANLNRIKLVLVEKNKTGKWLADELGKTPSTVSKWCQNQPFTLQFITSVWEETSPEVADALVILTEEACSFRNDMVLREEDALKFKNPEDAQPVFQMLLLMAEGYAARYRGAAAFDFQAVMEDFEKNIAILRKNFYKEEYLK